MHDPASDVKKPSGSVQAASGAAPKPNPVQGVFVVDKDGRGRLRAKFAPYPPA